MSASKRLKKVKKEAEQNVRGMAKTLISQVKAEVRKGRKKFDRAAILGVSGKGKYKLGKSIGKLVGRALGASIGDPESGANLGGAFGGGIEKLARGKGSYQINSLVNGAKPNREIPRFNYGDEDSSLYIVHREYVGDVFSTSSTAFSTQTFQINPGQSAVFPWLSQLAANYDEYDFEGLIFTFNPTVSDYNQTGAMGSVLLATIYNPAAGTFTSKQAMMEYDGAVTARPCDTIVHGVECDNRKVAAGGYRYVRSGSVPDGEDIKTYDHAKFVLGISGINSTSFPNGTQLGELWVSYKVRLRAPKFWANLGNAIAMDSFCGVTGVTTSIPMGTAPKKSTNNIIGGSLSKGTNSVYTFPDNFAGRVMIVYMVGAATSVGLQTSNIVAAGNIGNANIFSQTGGASNVNTLPTSGAVANRAIVIEAFVVSPASSAGGNTLTFDANTITGGATGSFLQISAVNPTLGLPTTFTDV